MTSPLISSSSSSSSRERRSSYQPPKPSPDILAACAEPVAQVGSQQRRQLAAWLVQLENLALNDPPLSTTSTTRSQRSSSFSTSSFSPAQGLTTFPSLNPAPSSPLSMAVLTRECPPTSSLPSSNLTAVTTASGVGVVSHRKRSIRLDSTPPPPPPPLVMSSLVSATSSATSSPVPKPAPLLPNRLAVVANLGDTPANNVVGRVRRASMAGEFNRPRRNSSIQGCAPNLVELISSLRSKEEIQSEEACSYLMRIIEALELKRVKGRPVVLREELDQGLARVINEGLTSADKERLLTKLNNDWLGTMVWQSLH